MSPDHPRTVLDNLKEKKVHNGISTIYCTHIELMMKLIKLNIFNCLWSQ